MAKKRKSNDNVMMYSIIAIVSLIIILSVALIISSLNEDNTTYEYTDPEFTSSYLYTYESFDDQPEDLYAIYYYSQTCSACTAIKQQVLREVISNDSDLKIYLVDSAYVTGDRSPIEVGTQTLRATPTMLVYRDGVLVELYEGAGSNSTEIPAFLSDVDRGNYSN